MHMHAPAMGWRPNPATHQLRRRGARVLVCGQLRRRPPHAPRASYCPPVCLLRVALLALLDEHHRRTYGGARRLARRRLSHQVAARLLQIELVVLGCAVRRRCQCALQRPLRVLPWAAGRVSVCRNQRAISAPAGWTQQQRIHYTEPFTQVEAFRRHPRFIPSEELHRRRWGVLWKHERTPVSRHTAASTHRAPQPTLT